MGLTKVTYTKGKTALSADNLNDIQDNIISNKQDIDKILIQISGIKSLLEELKNNFNQAGEEANEMQEKLIQINSKNHIIESKYENFENKNKYFENEIESIYDAMASFNKVTVGPEEPQSPKDGDIWFNPEDENILIIDDEVLDNDHLISNKGVFAALQDKLNLIKIWENALPSLAFLNQTIECKDLNYNLFLIVWRINDREGLDFYLSTLGFFNMDNYAAANGEYRVWQPCEEGIVFKITSHDNTLIPCQIYGIK